MSMFSGGPEWPDDPELAKLLASGNVVHQPGMAAEMMRELAPLLKADGIDLDDPNPDFTEAQLTDALTRAQERYNISLFSPVGVHRGLAMLVLHDFACMLSEVNTSTAGNLAATIPSDPVPGQASVAQVIGTGLGLLDTWYSDPELSPLVRAATAPKWSKASRSAARDILVLASKHRAFDSLDRLIANHAGFHTLEGTLLAVAGAVAMVARREGVDIDTAAERLIPTAEFDELVGDINPEEMREAAGAGNGESRSHAVPASSLAGSAFAAADDPFDEWGDEEYFDAITREIGSSENYRRFVAHLTKTFGPLEPRHGLLTSAIMIFGIAKGRGIDIGQPSGVAALLDEIEDIARREPDPDEAAAILSSGFTTLDEYVHHRMEIDPEPARWRDVHEAVERVGAQADPMLSVLLAEVSATPEASEGSAAALSQLPIVRGASALLAWIGQSRKVSRSGQLRRSDIAEAAGFFGITAVDVSSDPRQDTVGADVTYYVLSATEVPVLGPVWQAMEIIGLISTNSSSVRPGPAVGYSADDALPEPAMRDLVAITTLQVLLASARDAAGGIDDGVATAAAYRLTQILRPDDAPTLPDGDAPRRMLIEETVDTVIEDLVELEFLTVEADGRLTVLPEVRFSLAKAVLMSLSVSGELVDGPETIA